MHRILTNIFAGGCTLALLSALSIGAWAQTTYQVDVNRGTVVYVSGNDLIVRMEDNQLKYFSVPSYYQFTIDGKQVSVHDLKPGTKLTQTITTTIVEQSVTDVRTVDAKILEVKPPYLTFAMGDTIKRVKVPDGTLFTIDGKQMMLPDLKEGMRVKGTVATTVPTSGYVTATKVTGKTPSKNAVATPTMEGVLLIEEVDKPSK